jgi:hypothetical protein
MPISFEEVPNEAGLEVRGVQVSHPIQVNRIAIRRHFTLNKGKPRVITSVIL